MTIISHLDRRQKKALRDRFRVGKTTLYDVARGEQKNEALYEAIVLQAEENKRLRDRAAELKK